MITKFEEYGPMLWCDCFNQLKARCLFRNLNIANCKYGCALRRIIFLFEPLILKRSDMYLPLSIPISFFFVCYSFWKSLAICDSTLRYKISQIFIVSIILIN